MESVVTHSNVMSPQYILHRASIMAKNLPPSIQPDQPALLRMYAYHKQGSIGDNPDPRPGKLVSTGDLIDFKLMRGAETDPAELARWDIRKGMQGLNKDAASRRYVSTLQEVLQASDAPEAKKLLGQLQALYASGLPR